MYVSTDFIRYQLIDSEGQWKEVQRRQAEGTNGIQEATVIRPQSGYINSGIETESEHSTCHHHRRKHRKHRYVICSSLYY